jgi:lysophospholipase L1-like esterase
MKGTLIAALLAMACSPGAVPEPATPAPPASTASRGTATAPASAPSAGDAAPASDATPTPPDVEGTPIQTEPAESGGALPAGTTVLQIGDSFAGALGIDLNRELKDAGVRGVLKYQQSTYIPTWASSKDLDGYLQRFHPDLVLITLGANELLIPDPSARVPTIHRLVGRLGGRPCVWIAPPLWQGARPVLLDTIRESCAPCVYLDSSALVPDLQRMRDHIHPSMQARKIWAKAVVGWLREHRNPAGSRPWDLNP